MIVLDASVACKLAIIEEGTAIATDLVERAERITAPAIIRLEVSGAVLRRYRMGQYAEEDARDALSRWDNVLEERFEPLLEVERLRLDAVELAFRLKHPVVDCLYLAAAITLGCPLVTADAKLCERGRSVHEQVTLLAKAA